METAKYFKGGEQKDCLWYAVECLLGDMDPHDVPYPYGAAIIQMLASVNFAKERYDRSVENGAKGGRPTKWVEQKEAEALYAKLKSWKAVAEALGIDEDTLRKARFAWSRKTEKPKNLNVNDNDNVNANDNDNENVISINNSNNGSSREPSKGPALPEMKEEGRWLCEPYQIKDGRWAAEFEPAGGESRLIVFDAV